MRSQNEFSYGGDATVKRPELEKEISDQEIACSAKIRSTQNEISGKLKITHNSGYFLFDEPISATSPGQACVFYKNDQVLGGGWIT